MKYNERIEPIPHTDFVKVITDNLFLTKDNRYAWLRLSYAREWVVIRQERASDTAWAYWVAHGFKAALRDDYKGCCKAADELKRLAYG